MRARVVCNRYAPGYRSVSVRIQKNQLFRDVYPRNVCLPRINNTIHRKVFVFRGQKSVSNRCKILYLKISNAPICTVLTPDARTVYNAIMIFAPEQNLKTQSKCSRNRKNRLLRFWAGIIFRSTTSVNILPQRKALLTITISRALVLFPTQGNL